MKLRVQKLSREAFLPRRAHPTDAGLDLFANHGYLIPRYSRVVVGTSIAVEIPEGYVALIWDRSGLAAKHGITVLAGVIDASYRGEWKVVLHNTTSERFWVEKGMGIAQALIQKIELCSCVEVEALPPSPRGDGGFGSTGL